MHCRKSTNYQRCMLVMDNRSQCGIQRCSVHVPNLLWQQSGGLNFHIIQLLCNLLGYLNILIDMNNKDRQRKFNNTWWINNLMSYLFKITALVTFITSQIFERLQLFNCIILNRANEKKKTIIKIIV